MILIIDGYNLLKQIFPGVKQNLDKQKNVFIKQLSFYKFKKTNQISEIIVVFDAGPSTHATREIKSGIVVIYSGVKSSADEWILHFVERNKGKELLVITLDRALRNSCHLLKADTMAVYDFYKIMQQNLLEQATETFTQSEQTIKKYAALPDDDIASTVDSTGLDLLMEQSSVQMQDKIQADLVEEKASRSSKAKRAPKQNRRLLKKINKL